MSAASVQVGILTGPSDPLGCALSQEQQALLDFVAPAAVQIPCNFPYALQTPPHRAMPLLRASLHNGWAYLRSRGTGFRRAYRAAVMQRLEHCEHSVLLAGSCGLELFNNLALPRGILKRVSVFAYGPVARRRPDCHHVLVVGRRDPLSRWFFPSPDHWVEATHLGYLQDGQLRALCREFVTGALR
jgi:hypothetical protein